MSFMKDTICYVTYLIVVLTIPLYSIASASPESELIMHLSHNENGIIPDNTSVTIRIEALKNSKRIPSDIKIILTLPERNALFTTEYPVIEGTTLTAAHFKTENGLLEFTTIFPIRGKYSLKASAMPNGSSNSSSKLENTFFINVGEDPHDIINFLILTAFLLLLGILSGYIFGKSKNILNKSP